MTIIIRGTIQKLIILRKNVISLSSKIIVLLVTVDVLSFPWVMLILVLIALLVAWRAREHGFTSKSG